MPHEIRLHVAAINMNNNLEVIDTTTRPMGGIAPTPDKGIVLEGTHFYTAEAVPFVDPLQPIHINVQDLRDAVGYGLDRTDNEFWPFKKGELSCALKAIWDVWEDKPADADMHTLNGEYQAYLLALAHQTLSCSQVRHLSDLIYCNIA